MTPVGEAGSWTSRWALLRLPNGTVGVRPEEYETAPEATWTVSGTGSAPISSEAAKNDT